MPYNTLLVEAAMKEQEDNVEIISAIAKKAGYFIKLDSHFSEKDKERLKIAQETESKTRAARSHSPKENPRDFLEEALNAMEIPTDSPRADHERVASNLDAFFGAPVKRAPKPAKGPSADDLLTQIFMKSVDIVKESSSGKSHGKEIDDIKETDYDLLIDNFRKLDTRAKLIHLVPTYNNAMGMQHKDLTETTIVPPSQALSKNPKDIEKARAEEERMRREKIVEEEKTRRESVLDSLDSSRSGSPERPSSASTGRHTPDSHEQADRIKASMTKARHALPVKVTGKAVAKTPSPSAGR